MADVQLTYLQDLAAAGVISDADLLLIHQAGNEKSLTISALLSRVLSRKNPFSDIASDGAPAIAEALSNLGIKGAAKLDVATNAQMQAGTATNLLPTVAAVMSLFNKRSFGQNDFIRIPDVPGGLIVQWGKSGGADATGLIKINLPTTFTNSYQNAQAIYFSPNRRNIIPQVASLKETELQLFASFSDANSPAQSASLWWIAIGN